VPNSQYSVTARMGVVAAILEAPNGELRLSFDDVRTDTPADPREWKRVVHFTNTPLDPAKLTELSFSEKELADIAYNLLARLSAIRESDA
jgi:hypothetical protein